MGAPLFSKHGLSVDSSPLERFIRPYRITDGTKFKLADFDPGDTASLDSDSKRDAKAALAKGTEWLAEEQAKLAAQDRWALLTIFQARDAAGKDSTIKHVMRGVNPQGCRVRSFKKPSSEELDHDYLWRCHQHVPARGEIGIFNRSYYEEVLILRVHEKILSSQKLDPSLVTKNIWKERYEDINNFERYLTRNGTVILKFFLHVSREEQKKRFLDRLNEPEKHWKFSAADIRERRYWDVYTDAYENAIKHTASPEAPWFVIPADKKWFTRLVVAAAICQRLADLKLHYPVIGKDRLEEFEAARNELTQD